MIYLIFTIIFIYMMYYIWIAIHYNKRGERKGKNNKKNKTNYQPTKNTFFFSDFFSFRPQLLPPYTNSIFTYRVVSKVLY